MFCIYLGTAIHFIVFFKFEVREYLYIVGKKQKTLTDNHVSLGRNNCVIIGNEAFENCTYTYPPKLQM